MKETTAMADPADLVTLKLIFWHKGKQPGETVQVRRDEVRSWYGFAELVDDVEPAKADESAATGTQKTPDKTDDKAEDTPAPAAKAPAKTSTAK